MSDETTKSRRRAAVVDDVVAVPAAAPAPDRTAELEAENAQLKARVTELEGSLDALQRRRG